MSLADRYEHDPWEAQKHGADYCNIQVLCEDAMHPHRVSPYMGRTNEDDWDPRSDGDSVEDSYRKNEGSS